MKENTFKMVTEDGKEVTCNVLFTFDSEETKKSYIAYTDNTTDENGSIKVYASTYDPSGEDLSLKPLTDEKEWKVINSILSSIQEKVSEAVKEAQDGDESASE